jgi:type II secretory pathway pseudopilin PulG
MKAHNNIPIRRTAGGMTLVELMVSAVVLATMILAAGRIISQAQRVVVSSEAMLQGNSQALAIAQVLRDDMRQVTPHGFLAISHSQKAWNSDSAILMATIAEPAQSVSGSAQQLASLLVIGQCSLTSTSRSGIFRSRLVLANTSVNPDGLDYDFGLMQAMSRGQVDGYVPGSIATSAYPSASNIGVTVPGTFFDAIVNRSDTYIANSITLPPTGLSGVNDLWRLLGPDCHELSIHWTDGEIDSSGRLKWFGAGAGGAVAAKDPNWVSRNSSNYASYTEYRIPKWNYIEFGSNIYRAVFTRENVENSGGLAGARWPVAVRFRFILRVAGAADTEHEIICPVGQ